MEDTSMTQWRKSSYSNGGESACVEVATWRKSSYSNGGSAACVEVASTDGVLVRDTTNRDGGTLAFSAETWELFTASLR
jgi:Domain of unknown function (DUF397)